MEEAKEETRAKEWYVPRFGPRRFRLLVGLSFYPYTLMNLSYVVIGSLLAPFVHFDRVAGMALVYLLGVGVTAHSLDAMAPNKPWGTFITRHQLLLLAVTGLVPALVLGLYYALVYAPLLLVVGGLELFFLFSYNLELFRGRFHTNLWFALSWGFLPVIAGYVAQTNAVGLASLVGGAFGFCSAYVEINASRPYKTLKKEGSHLGSAFASRFESILKAVVASVLAVAVVLYALRFLG